MQISPRFSSLYKTDVTQAYYRQGFATPHDPSVASAYFRKVSDYAQQEDKRLWRAKAQKNDVIAFQYQGDMFLSTRKDTDNLQHIGSQLRHLANLFPAFEQSIKADGFDTANYDLAGKLYIETQYPKIRKLSIKALVDQQIAERQSKSS